MILLVFMVLMPILLMNLLIGLAVGDIEKAKKKAQMKRLAVQVRVSWVASVGFQETFYDVYISFHLFGPDNKLHSATEEF